MAKTYSELEAWGIFGGAFIIGVVLTSLFWAYITVPEGVKKIEVELKNTSQSADLISIETPSDFVTFCDKIEGTPSWDNTGFRQCVIKDYSEKNVGTMNFLCRKFNLTFSYGSFGIKCEGSV